MFLLDSSVSQTEEEFGKQLEFVQKFVDEIEIGPDAFNVAVITYSLDAVVEVYPNSSISKDHLKVGTHIFFLFPINSQDVCLLLVCN